MIFYALLAQQKIVHKFFNAESLRHRDDDVSILTLSSDSLGEACLQNLDDRFHDLGTPRRVFAIGALEGDADRLGILHDHLLDYMQPGDRIVYLGDYIKDRRDGLAALDELLLFRRIMMIRPGVQATDFIYLRGVYEDAWQRLLRLPFARNPEKTLERLLDEGAEHYLVAYGLDYRDGQNAVRIGIPAIMRWVHQLRLEQRAYPGHEPLMRSMRRAAYTSGEQRLLFVPCGFDPSKTLEEQDRALWSGTSGFGRIVEPTQGYSRIIRGRDAAALGLRADDITLTLDSMEGKGPILCAEIMPDGRISDLLKIHPAADEKETIPSFSPEKSRTQAENIALT